MQLGRKLKSRAIHFRHCGNTVPNDEIFFYDGPSDMGSSIL